jgi:hypothetical protein
VIVLDANLRCAYDSGSLLYERARRWSEQIFSEGSLLGCRGKQ